jgi:hypothetical protein|tara:strand:- start:5814 stop:6890 length:1077 start_codon:yes stop_codon:yes gene_type:complete
MDVYNIIRQLTDQEDMISGHMQRECFNQLLPIIEYYKGWNFHEDETRFNFYPHEDYHKERYEVKINVDDNMERVEKIEALNQDIDEYNDWVNEKNELHSKELFEKAIPDGKVPDAKELNIVNPCYTIIGKHKPWLCTFIIEKPQFRNISNALDFGYLDDEEIYKLKEGMDIKEFVERFNATLYDYIRQSVGWLEMNHAWGEDSLWYDPNREFANWFERKKLRPIISDIEPTSDGFKAVEPFKTGFFKTGGLPKFSALAYSPLTQVVPETNDIITNAQMNEEVKQLFDIKDWTVPQREIEEEMRQIFLKNKHEPFFYDEDKAKPTITKCYDWACKFWTQNGKRITPKQMQNASKQILKR